MAEHGSAFVIKTGDSYFLKIVNYMSTIAGWCSASMIVIDVGITCQMIFVRFVLNQSTIWQTEAVIYLIISATLIGLSYVQSIRGHVNVDLIPLMLPLKARLFLALLTQTVAIVMVA
ncbi:MAG: TRAP transporter small permease subunit, partial [Rhizobiales bacterium]|nr:TRAP transporter small permease subunit [Hyphomicrobiales bacterium]